MLKHVVVFSKNQNWSLYTLELQSVKNFDGDPMFEIDTTVHSYTTMGRSWYQIPTRLKRRHQIHPKYVFDSREAAQAGIDTLIHDNIQDELDNKKKQIEFLHEEIDKLQHLTPRGKYRNFVKPPKPKP